MKIILDNCVHIGAKRFFVGHEVQHARDVGWKELSNGELIAKAAAAFEVLVTTDKKMRYEHNLEKLPLPIIELNTKFTRLQDLQTLAPFLEAALAATATHRFVSIHPDGTLELLA
jgi:hypothetical protein